MPVQQIIVNPAETETVDNSKSPPTKMSKEGESSAAMAAPYSSHNLRNSGTCSQCSSVSELQTSHLNSVSNHLPQRSGSCLSTTSNGIICRICHCESEPSNPLITPCLCIGTLHYVHQGCLQQWIKSSDAKKCELCRYEFQMEAKTKPFRKWQALDMSQSERRKILCSVSFHVIAITCVVWSLWVLIDRTAQEIEEGHFDWSFWTKLVVVAIGFTGGVVFMYVQCKVYVQLWKRLRAYNRIILVKNAPHIADTAQYL